jgi:hypothetical protein
MGSKDASRRWRDCTRVSTLALRFGFLGSRALSRGKQRDGADTLDERALEPRATATIDARPC